MKEKNYGEIISESLLETKAVFVFECVLELIFGLFLVIYPDQVSSIVSIVLGAVLAGYGVFNIISFLMSRTVPFRQGLFSGVISTAVGIALIVQADALAGVVGIILGVFVVFEGLSCCRRAFLMRQLEYPVWKIPFIISLLTTVLGAAILIFPSFFSNLLMIIVGIVLIIEAALGFWTIIGIIRLRRKFSQYMNDQTKIVSIDKE